MTKERLTHLRKTAETHRSKNPNCVKVIIELLDYIEELKNPPVKNLNGAELMARARKWFGRRENTSFDASEIKAIKAVAKNPLNTDDLDLLDWWFSLPSEECFQKYGNGRKKTIASLFNSFQAEIEKARSAKGTSKPSPQILVNEKLDHTEYLQWLDSHDWGDRMKPWWRNLKTAPHSLIADFLEFKKQAI